MDSFAWAQAAERTFAESRLEDSNGDARLHFGMSLRRVGLAQANTLFLRGSQHQFLSAKD